MPEAEPHILFEKRGALGLVTLNRPRALNALTHGMCIGLARKLAEWAADPAIGAVVIRGAGPRAFCAGGDIRALMESASGGTRYAASFFWDEYRLNAAIAAYPKPYIALLHGIVMGGGVGVSAHGRYRLADASLVWAMPETGIGLVTDIGASHFLSRMPDEMGLYLALTGARIGQGDAMALGLVTHCVAASDHEALLEKLAAGEDVMRVVDTFATRPGLAPLAAERKRIAAIFSASSIEAIFERLERDGSEFATATAQTLRAMSPSALKFTFRALREGRALSLHECLRQEYRIALRAIPAHDFQEGVRAALIDKNAKPVWNPPSLAALSDADIARYFAGLGAGELSFA